MTPIGREAAYKYILQETWIWLLAGSPVIHPTMAITKKLIFLEPKKFREE
jgi:hypothetical protein